MAEWVRCEMAGEMLYKPYRPLEPSDRRPCRVGQMKSRGPVMQEVRLDACASCPVPQMAAALEACEPCTGCHDAHTEQVHARWRAALAAYRKGGR
jgi:hypothetical protein